MPNDIGYEKSAAMLHDEYGVDSKDMQEGVALLAINIDGGVLVHSRLSDDLMKNEIIKAVTAALVGVQYKFRFQEFRDEMINYAIQERPDMFTTDPMQ